MDDYLFINHAGAALNLKIGVFAALAFTTAAVYGAYLQALVADLLTPTPEE